MKKKILFIAFAVMASLASALFVTEPTPSYAAAICDGKPNPLAITRWCEGVEEVQKFNSSDEIASFIAAIASNVGQMIADIAAYVAVALVMYGGFLYMTSSGDPGKTASGRKTIINACIGIVIVKSFKLILAVVSQVAKIVNTNKDINQIAGELAGEFLFWGGAICVIMIIWGGLQYTTSAGDPGKVQKSKQTILYAVIGLVAMILAATIVHFVMQTFK